MTLSRRSPLGQIEIDVGPAFPAFVQETLENEMVADRIDRRDAETKTNGAVRGAAAPLHHDVVFATKIDDVPDDQKITGEPKLLNEGQLFVELCFDRATDRGVTLLRTEKSDSAEERIHRMAGRHRVIGKIVAEIFERKLKALGETERVVDRVGSIAKERFHFRAVF